MGRKVLDLHIYKIREKKVRDYASIDRNVAAVLDAPEEKTIQVKDDLGKFIAIVDENGGVIGRRLKWRLRRSLLFIAGRIEGDELNFFLFDARRRNAEYEQIEVPSIKEGDAHSLPGDKYYVVVHSTNAENKDSQYKEYREDVDWHFKKKLPARKEFLVKDGVKLGTRKEATGGDPRC